MTVDLSANIEERVKRLAQQQGRDVRVVVEEAVRQYVEAASLTDLTPEQIGETQMKLAGELNGLTPWHDRPEDSQNEAG